MAFVKHENVFKRRTFPSVRSLFLAHIPHELCVCCFATFYHFNLHLSVNVMYKGQLKKQRNNDIRKTGVVSSLSFQVPSSRRRGQRTRTRTSRRSTTWRRGSWQSGLADSLRHERAVRFGTAELVFRHFAL